MLSYLILYKYLIAAAVIPALVLMIYIYRQDKLEKEPTGLLVRLAVMGILSTFLAGFTESIGSDILGVFLEEDTTIYNAVFYFGIVALSEEGFKYYFLKKVTWNSPAFNCRFDGVVYAVFVALGFALFENILYVFQFGLMTAAIRAVTAVPGHACDGVFMGAWYGMAKQYDVQGRDGKCRSSLRLALIIPVLLHGVYDFLLSVDSEAATLLFLAFVLAFFAASFSAVKRMSGSDGYI